MRTVEPLWLDSIPPYPEIRRLALGRALANGKRKVLLQPVAVFCSWDVDHDVEEYHPDHPFVVLTVPEHHRRGDEIPLETPEDCDECGSPVHMSAVRVV